MMLTAISALAAYQAPSVPVCSRPAGEIIPSVSREIDPAGLGGRLQNGAFYFGPLLFDSANTLDTRAVQLGPFTDYFGPLATARAANGCLIRWKIEWGKGPMGGKAARLFDLEITGDPGARRASGCSEGPELKGYRFVQGNRFFGGSSNCIGLWRAEGGDGQRTAIVTFGSGEPHILTTVPLSLDALWALPGIDTPGGALDIIGGGGPDEPITVVRFDYR